MNYAAHCQWNIVTFENAKPLVIKMIMVNKFKGANTIHYYCWEKITEKGDGHPDYWQVVKHIPDFNTFVSSFMKHIYGSTWKFEMGSHHFVAYITDFNDVPRIACSIKTN